MTCPSCNGHGLFKVCYHEGDPTDYALCLCKAGEAMRCARNNGKPVTPQWQVWAHRQGIDPARVAPMEDLLTAEELAARGFTELGADDRHTLEAIASAAKARSARGK